MAAFVLLWKLPCPAACCGVGATEAGRSIEGDILVVDLSVAGLCGVRLAVALDLD